MGNSKFLNCFFLILVLIFSSCSVKRNNKSEVERKALEYLGLSGFDSPSQDLTIYENIKSIGKDDTVIVGIKNGLLNGPFKVAYSGGDLAIEGRFANGSPEGEFKFFSKKGKLLEIVNFSSGKKHGQRRKYHLDGHEEFGYYDQGKLIYYKKLSASRKLEENMIGAVITGDIVKKDQFYLNDTLEFNFEVMYSVFKSPLYKYILELNNDTVDIELGYSKLYSTYVKNLAVGKNVIELHVFEIDSASRILTGFTDFKYVIDVIEN